MTSTCCFLHQSLFCSVKEKVLMEVLLDFYQKNCHAVHDLTFLFRSLPMVLFHPTHTAIMYMEIPL